MISQVERGRNLLAAELQRIWRALWRERSTIAASRLATVGALLLLVAAWAPLASWASSSGGAESRGDVTGAIGVMYVMPYFALFRGFAWAPMLPMLWAPIFIIGACLAGALWLAPQRSGLARQPWCIGSVVDRRECRDGHGAAGCVHPTQRQRRTLRGRLWLASGCAGGVGRMGGGGRRRGRMVGRVDSAAEPRPRPVTDTNDKAASSQRCTVIAMWYDCLKCS